MFLDSLKKKKKNISSPHQQVCEDKPKLSVLSELILFGYSQT